MNSISDIIKHATASIRAGIPLRSCLNRQELAVFARNYKPYTFNKSHPPQFEFECWSGLSKSALIEMVKKLDSTIPCRTKNLTNSGGHVCTSHGREQCHLCNREDEQEYVLNRDSVSWGFRRYSSARWRPRTQDNIYPYKEWYFHSDGSIQGDEAKVAKLAQIGQFPISVKLSDKVVREDNNNEGSYDIEPVRLSEGSDIRGTMEIDILNEGENESSYVKKIRDLVVKEASSLIKVVKDLNEVATNIITTKSTLLGKITYSCIEISSPGLYDMRQTRNLFYIFKTKGPSGAPLVFVNKTCGLHISFQLPLGDHGRKQTVLNRLAALYYQLEPQIYEIVPDHRRNNHYAVQARTHGHSDSFQRNSGKYSALNLNKTNDMVEFRFMNATSNINQIHNWLRFLAQIFDYALNIDKPISSTTHLFDVVDNLYIQDWYLNRKQFLNTKALVDKATDLNAIKFSKPTPKPDEPKEYKSPVKINDVKHKKEPESSKLTSRKSKAFLSNFGTLNSRFNQR